MPQRFYNRRSFTSIIIGAVLMIVINQAFFKERKPTPVEEAPLIIEIQKGDVPEAPPVPTPVVLGEAKPVFASARDLSTDQTLMPVIAEQPIWQKNAVQSTVPKNKPRIALIIDDMGLDLKHSHEAMDLPGPLTMSFMPYARKLREQTSYAISKGHELMVHVPMQPENGSLNAGPDVLKTWQAPEQFLTTLDNDLKAFGGYVGINNHMGSKMTQDRPGMERLMKELKKRGLLFVDSKTIATSVAADEAKKAGVPYASRNIFVDDEETNKAIEGSLEHIENMALTKGLSIAIAHPRKETVEALREWLPTLKAKGIELVPISAVVTIPPEPETSLQPSIPK